MVVKPSPPPLEVVDDSVAMMEDRRLELEVTVVMEEVGAMLEVGGAGVTFGDVVFRAGHPEDPVSRRVGQ